MKKLLLVLGLVGVLIGCGMKTYSPEEKRELILKGYSEDKATREAAADKYYEILRELSRLENKGNEKAYAEYKEWRSTVEKVSREVRIKKEAISTVEFRKKHKEINEEQYRKELIEAKKDPKAYSERIERERPLFPHFK